MEESAGRGTPAAEAPAPIARRSLHDQVVGRVRDLITDGTLAPGTRIKEGQLGAQLGVSRTPLREALKFLASEGLVELVAARGAIVRRFTAKDVRDMLDVLAVLESFAARLACRVASDEDIAEVRRLHDRMVERYAARDRLEYFKLNQQIHSAFLRLAGRHPQDAELALKLPSPVTLSIMTYAPNAATLAKRARIGGHEIMVHMPMEPVDHSADPGPNALLVGLTENEIRRRASVLPVGVDTGVQTISPDGKTLLLTAQAAGRQNLYAYSLDELAREPAVARQLTSTPGFKSDAQFSPDSKEVYYLEQGRLNIAALDGSRPPRALNVTAELDVDFALEKNEVFRQAWTYLRDGFYDDKFHGANWEAVRAEYAPQIAGALTPDEMRRLLNLMVGELNASHLGVSAPQTGGGGGGAVAGKLGLRFDRAEYERAGRLRVTEVIALSPAAVSRQIKAGDYLLAVDGVTISARTNLDELLSHKIGRRVALRVAASADGANAREVALQPISQAAEKNLLYRHWVEANRTYVERVSGGRLGYVHMLDMGEGSLTRLYLDLDADNRAKDGVVIDVRNNNGGFVNVYAIDVLARRGYLTMTPRGQPAAPARSVLGQRSLELPTILVANQHSLSDAEDFTEGYRTLKLGKVVGEPTAGWIIYTGQQTLVDGSGLRMPGIRITTNEGATMELNPRPVDVPVTRPVGESYAAKDSQLDTAVRELLKQLDGAKAATSRRQ